MTREMLFSFKPSDTMKSMGERAIGERLARMRASALCAGEAFRNMATIAPGLRDLVMHAWDEPAETLLRLAPQQGVHLVMPQLGQAVEPAQVDSVTFVVARCGATRRGSARADDLAQVAGLARGLSDPEAPRRGVNLCKARDLTVIGVRAVGVARGQVRFWRISGSLLEYPHMASSPMADRSRLRLVLALATSTALGACIVVPAGRRYGGRGVDADDDEIVSVAPPQPHAEIMVAAPGPGYFWVSGYWGWIGARHVWIGGRWEGHRPGWRWSPFAWQRHRHGWRAAPGRWDRH